MLGMAAVEVSTLDQVYGITRTGMTMSKSGQKVQISYVPGGPRHRRAVNRKCAATSLSKSFSERSGALCRDECSHLSSAPLANSTPEPLNPPTPL